MQLPKLEVPDDYVDLALAAPSELLQPGANPEVQQWVSNQCIPANDLGSFAVLWTLNESQISAFAEELDSPTPTTYPSFENHVIDRHGILQLLLAASLGKSFGVATQRNGVVLQDVFPKDGLFDRANSGLGATAPFDFHTDQAFSPRSDERPNSVLLACVRNIEQATTGIVSLNDTLRPLSTSTIESLQRQDFAIFTGREAEGLGKDQTAVLFENEIGLSIRLGGDTVGTTPDSKCALGALKASLKNQKNQNTVVLEAGQSLAFDNDTTIHFRTGFVPAQKIILPAATPVI